MSAHLYIIRGVPGAGKTTLAKQIARSHFEACFFYAADDWFDIHNGGIFDASRLGEAHSWCLNSVKAGLQKNRPVFVHNTFTTEKELKPYIDFCNENNIPFTCIVVENRHGNKSVHNVPEEKVNQMRERLRGSIKL